MHEFFLDFLPLPIPLANLYFSIDESNLCNTSCAGARFLRKMLKRLKQRVLPKVAFRASEGQSYLSERRQTFKPSTLNRIWRTSSLPAPLYNKYLYKAQQGLGIDASPFPQLQQLGLVSQVPLLDVRLDLPPPISGPQFPHL